MEKYKKKIILKHFLKRSPLLRDLSLSFSLVVILYTAHYATQFPSTQAVRCQLLVLLTLNFFGCKPLTVCKTVFFQ